MKPIDIYNHYLNYYRFSKGTGFEANSLRHWLKTGNVPIASQIRVESATDGVLRADLQDDKNIKGGVFMNFRSLLRLKECEIEEIEPKNHDNYYRNRMTFVLNQTDCTSKECLYLKDEEVGHLKESLTLVLEALKDA